MAWHLEKRFDLYDGCEILSKKKIILKRNKTIFGFKLIAFTKVPGNLLNTDCPHVAFK
jgi:hypothetical protein